MLETDIGDEMCWSQILDVRDGFAILVTNIRYFFHQLWVPTLNDIIDIEIQSPTSINRLYGEKERIQNPPHFFVTVSSWNNI